MNQIRIFDESFEAAFKNGVQFLKISTEDDNGSREPLTKWAPSSTSKLICSYCKTEFDDVVQQREHYKLDWHRYNLKQNLRVKPTITEEDFNEKADDVSSISGSDSEKEDSSENIAILRGRLFLKNSEGVVFSLYRCLLFEKKEELCDEILLKGLEKLHRNNQWTLLMLGGGHFAGGVFQGSTIILHKTFHAYVIRSGQGSSQRSMDNRSGSFQAKSAGASLRRYNELALTQHIHDIVRAWKKEIDNSSLIVYRAAGSFNQFVFFGGKAPLLDRSDSRLKTIPFVTKRPTFAELKRVHTLLTTVTMYESFDQVSGILKQEATDSSLKRSKKKTTNIDRAKSRENVERPSPINDSSMDDDVRVPNDSDENLEVDLIFSDQEISMSSVLQPFEDSLTVEERRQRKKKSKKDKLKHKRQIKEDLTRKKQLYDFVSSGHVQNLENHLKERGGGHVHMEIHNIALVNEVLDDVGNTLLHVAALHQQLEVIRFLLEKGADPCLRNQKQQTAYSCTQNNNVRKIFKNFAQEFPERHNYTKAQIPVPVELTEEQLNRRNAQRKLKKEKDKEKKKITQLIQQEECEKQRYLNLSDREKRALAAERRILSTNGSVVSRCFLCGTDISGKVPFEYSGNRFCSIDCLKAHRLSNSVILS
ncbi:hypothetical protein RN001_014096 [Aquatica leii]|uniref:VLRF1 domain-containing protein n=1 Tax=Aquatica leii TaxID=1421715 RepID=A0AAN7P3R2_9COLE|nr:hypothetical protein RN001_014096 [Aquatica leii]